VNLTLEFEVRNWQTDTKQPRDILECFCMGVNCVMMFPFFSSIPTDKELLLVLCWCYHMSSL